MQIIVELANTGVDAIDEQVLVAIHDPVARHADDALDVGFGWIDGIIEDDQSPRCSGAEMGRLANLMP